MVMKRLISVAAIFFLLNSHILWASDETRLLADGELRLFPSAHSPAVAILPAGSVVLAVSVEDGWTRVKYTGSDGAPVEGYVLSLLIESDEDPTLQAYAVGMYLLEKEELNRAVPYFRFFYEVAYNRLRAATQENTTPNHDTVSRVITAAAVLGRFSSSYPETYAALTDVVDLPVLVPLMYRIDPVFVTKLVEYQYRSDEVEGWESGLQVIRMLLERMVVPDEERAVFLDYQGILQRKIDGEIDED